MYFQVLYTVYTAVYLVMMYAISNSQNCFSHSSAPSIGGVVAPENLCQFVYHANFGHFVSCHVGVHKNPKKIWGLELHPKVGGVVEE